MHKFLMIPKDGLIINMDSIHSVTRTVPWKPVQCKQTDRMVNSDGSNLEVTITYGPTEDTYSFFGEDAIRMNEMFFAHGIYQMRPQATLWAVLDVSMSKSIPEPTHSQERSPFFDHTESIFQAYNRARKNQD